ncbi:MAG: hypothetical protein ACKPKO_16865, partial [Candidatus Fonsibacter sp.]
GIPTRLALGAEYLKSALDVYKDFNGANFDHYERLGTVRRPAPEEAEPGEELPEADSTVDKRFEDLPAADILQRFGIDFNVVLDLSDVNHQALPVRPKKRDRSYIECIDVREWLIDTGYGHDLLSKHDVAPYADFVQKAKSLVVFHTANGSTTTHNVARVQCQGAK